MPDQPEEKDQGERPPILDDTKRRKILALLANGSSRRVAAASRAAPIPAPEPPVYLTRDNDPPKPESFAPRTPEGEDDPETHPAPELLAIDQLQANQVAASQIAN